jgi:hypothetical protein
MTRVKSTSHCNPSKSKFRAAHSKSAFFNPQGSYFQLRPRSKYPFDYSFLEPEFYIRPIPLFADLTAETPSSFAYHIQFDWIDETIPISEAQVLQYQLYRFQTDNWYKFNGYSAPLYGNETPTGAFTFTPGALSSDCQ